MTHKHRLVLTNENCGKASLFLFIVYSFYYDLIERIPNYLLAFSMLIISVFLGLLSIFKNKKILLSSRLIKFISGWIILFLVFMIFRNRWIEHSFLWRTVRWVWAVFIVIVIAKNENIFDWIRKSLIIIGFPHVIATIFFFIFPGTYQVMVRIWGMYPHGTSNGRLGYKAALCIHYSHNAIMISIVFLCLAASIIYALNYRAADNSKKRTRIIILLALVSGFALVLTAKRGHVLFSIITIVIGYLICSPKLNLRIILRLTVFSILITALIIFAYQSIPEFGRVVERFQTTGEDYSSTVRLDMWEQAIEFFKLHPIFGIGWGGFRYESGFAIEAHNVYLNLLAETGIIGFIIYIVTVVMCFAKAYKSVKEYKKVNDKAYLVTSFSVLFIELFYLLYSITGNCLYDISFNFYVIALGSSYILSYNLRKKGETNEP